MTQRQPCPHAASFAHGRTLCTNHIAHEPRAAARKHDCDGRQARANAAKHTRAEPAPLRARSAPCAQCSETRADTPAASFRGIRVARARRTFAKCTYVHVWCFCPRAPPPPRRPAWWRTLRGDVNHPVITPILTHVQWPRTTPRLAARPLGHGRPPRYYPDINPRSVTQTRIARSRPRIHTPYFHTPRSRPGLPAALTPLREGEGRRVLGGGIPATRQGSMRLPPQHAPRTRQTDPPLTTKIPYR